MKQILLAIIATISFGAFAQQSLVPYQEGKKSPWGYKSTGGEVVIAPQFKDAQPFSEDGLALVLDGKTRKWAFIKKDGSKLPLPYKAFTPTFGKKGFVDGIAIINTDGRKALINTAGKEVYPPHFDKMSTFVEDRSIAKIGSTWFILDREGNRTKVQVSCMEVNYVKNGIAPYRATSKSFGFIKADGEVLIRARYKAVGYFHNGIAWARNFGDKIGFIAKPSLN